MRVLLTGAGGQVGRAVVAAGGGSVQVVGLTRADLDICDANAVSRIGQVHQPDVVVNAAAFTAVDFAEQRKEDAFRVNADGVENLARMCRAESIPLIHISTDYVFDGTNEAPYAEFDVPNPLGVYGASKLEGEGRLRAIRPDHVILRTSWVFSETGSNFVKTILRLARERDELRIVADQWGRPTAAGDIARTCLTLARRLCEAGSEVTGVYHFGGDPPVSWFELALAIVRIAGEREDLAVRKITPITTADYPTPAKRPENSVLDCAKICAQFGLTLPSWEHSLRKVLDTLGRVGSATAIQTSELA